MKVKTFEAACKKLGIDPKKAVPALPDNPHNKALIALAKLFIIIQVINDGWKPDWNNNDEYKYYPWFDMEKTKSNPSGFSLDGVYDYYAASGVGSRLCFKSRDLAEYTVKQFIDLYKDYMVFDK
jgi:hypothetical protein